MQGAGNSVTNPLDGLVEGARAHHRIVDGWPAGAEGDLHMVQPGRGQLGHVGGMRHAAAVAVQPDNVAQPVGVVYDRA